jgi:CBS domain containing-hemolysin-like protein
MSSHNLVLLFTALLGLSFVFAATEIALFSVPRARARRHAQEAGVVGDVFRRLLDTPHSILVQILLGNTLINVAATSVAAVLLDRAVRGIGAPEWLLVGAQTIGLTALLLVLCEMTPKTLAFERNEQMAPLFARVYAVLRPVLAPVARALEGLAGAVARMVQAGRSEPLTADELETLVEVGAREGTLNPEESRLFRGAFRFGERTAGEILVPRADVVAIAADAPVADALVLMGAARHARIPAYEGTLDRVVGVLYAKDLVAWTLADPGDRTVRALLRPPFVVPAGMGLEALLRSFQAQRVHLAVVADPAGRALGVVTLEDVLEEIVGEIEDEFEEEEPAFRPLGEGAGIFLGTVRVGEANRLLGVSMPGRAGETLAGLFERLRPEAPAEGETLEVDGARLTVEAATGRRVWSMRVERVAPAAPPAAAGGGGS